MPSEKMNEKQILKLMKEYAKKAGFELNKDKKGLAYVIKGLKKKADNLPTDLLAFISASS